MGNINSILQLINPDNTITANRALAHAIGMTETIIYSALISKYSYYEKLGKLFEDEWFYCTYDDLQESTTFPGKIQKKAIDHLVELGLVKSMVFGMPAKRYMTISDNVDLLEKLLDEGIERARELTRKSLDKQREYISKRKVKGNPDEDEAESLENQLLRQNGVTSYAEMEQQVTPEWSNKFRRNGVTSLDDIEDTEVAEEKSLENQLFRQNGVTSYAETEQQVTPDWSNKLRRNGATCSADLAYKSKDNKTKAEESKGNQSIYLEKENVYYSYQYKGGMTGCIAMGGPVEEAVDAAVRFGFEAYTDESEVIMFRKKIAENIGLRWFIADLMERKPINLEEAEGIREIYDLICDVVCNRQPVKIKGITYDWAMVRAQFLKLGHEQVRNVFERIQDGGQEIKSMRSYLISSLYSENLYVRPKLDNCRRLELASNKAKIK
ncbi:MAG: hypothetical protein J5959_17060 [Butyrivibrio sp.]|nr:hypothetical protein [Butyrivibrio sp.]